MFFTVKKGIKIAGKVYMPCICYLVTKFLEKTLVKLSNEGKVTFYSEMVFFQNGKIIKTENMLREEKKEAKKAERKAKKEAKKETTVIDETEGF